MNGITTKSTKLQIVQNKYLLTTEGIMLRRQIRTQRNTKKITTHTIQDVLFKADVQLNKKPRVTFELVPL